MFVIRTKIGPPIYVHQVHGVCYVTFVTDLDHVKKFPTEESATTWAETLSKWQDMELVAVRLSDEIAAKAATAKTA